MAIVGGSGMSAGAVGTVKIAPVKVLAVNPYSLSFDFTVPTTTVPTTNASAQAVVGGQPNVQLKGSKNTPLRQQATLDVVNPKFAKENPVTIGSSGVLR